MYTAKIKSIEKQADKATVVMVAVFTNEQNIEVERLINMPYGFTKNQLKEELRSQINRLEQTDETIQAIALNTVIDLTKTAKEKDRENLEVLLADIDKTERLATLGVLTKTEAGTELATKRTEAKALVGKLK